MRNRGIWLQRLALGLLLSATAAACDSIDPTEQTFGITFANDTGRPVHLQLCSNDSCTSFDYSDGWKVGQRRGEGISDRNVLTRWLVHDDRSGRTLGCLPLRFDQKYSDAVVRISQMVACPGVHPLEVQKGKGHGRS